MIATKVISERKDFWAKLIQSNNTALEAFLLRRIQNRDDVSDIIQETYIRLVGIQPNKIVSPQAYMFRTAANSAINYHKKERKHIHEQRAVEADDKLALNKTVQVGGPEHHFEASRQREILLSSLKTLPVNCRTAFILHRFYPDTYPQIAQKLNVSVSMVEKYIAQALSHCRHTMEQTK